jgi:hypothetical protein
MKEYWDNSHKNRIPTNLVQLFTGFGTAFFGKKNWFAACTFCFCGFQLHIKPCISFFENILKLRVEFYDSEEGFGKFRNKVQTDKTMRKTIVLKLQ